MEMSKTINRDKIIYQLNRLICIKIKLFIKHLPRIQVLEEKFNLC
jgi:hypothetical protein